MVCSYLVHHGYVGAAEAFAKSTGQDIDEDWTNIRNRQAIQKLVLAGKMGEAIQLTDRLYPGFLQSHPALHFMLKVHCSRSLFVNFWTLVHFLNFDPFLHLSLFSRCGNSSKWSAAMMKMMMTIITTMITKM